MAAMPPMDPMMGMAGLAPMPAPAPAPVPAGDSGRGVKTKFDPLMLDYRLYNLQQIVTAIANALGVQIPPGALVMPPGSSGSPPAEMALPGGPMDPMQQAMAAGAMAAPPGGAVPGGAPPPAAAAAGPPEGASKVAQYFSNTPIAQFVDELLKNDTAAQSIGTPFPDTNRSNSTVNNAAALAAMMRSLTRKST